MQTAKNLAILPSSIKHFNHLYSAAEAATSLPCRFSISCVAAKAFAWRHKHDLCYAWVRTDRLTERNAITRSIQYIDPDDKAAALTRKRRLWAAMKWPDTVDRADQLYEWDRASRAWFLQCQSTTTSHSVACCTTNDTKAGFFVLITSFGSQSISVVESELHYKLTKHVPRALDCLFITNADYIIDVGRIFESVYLFVCLSAA